MTDHKPIPEHEMYGGVHCQICRYPVELIDPLKDEWTHTKLQNPGYGLTQFHQNGSNGQPAEGPI